LKLIFYSHLYFLKDYNAAKGQYLKYKYQNYTVAYQSEQKRKVGIIQNFFKIKNSIYCIISKLEKYKNLIELNEETQFVIENLDRFFLIFKRSVNFDFKKIEDIVSKCVLLKQNEDYFVSIFNENDEILKLRIFYH
jgi:hypothetical protein